MADRIGINLQAGLNISQATSNIDKQIQKIQEALKPLNININDKVLIQAFDKITDSINVSSNGASQLEKNIINVTSDTGQLVKITQTYNEQQKQMLISGIDVVNNLKQQTLEAEKLANAMANAREKSQLRVANANSKWDLTQNTAINNNLDQVYQEAERERAIRVQSQQEVSDLARRLIIEEENQRIATTTETQRRIEQTILGSNETIAQQQQRMNSVNANNYEQMWLRALQQQEQAEQRNLQNERQKTTELERQIALYREQVSIQLQNLRSQFGSKLYNNTGVQSSISSINTSVLNLNPQNFREQSQQINSSISQVRANLNTLRADSNNFATTLVKDFGKMMAWSLVATAMFAPIRAIESAIEFTNSLNKSMTNIQMITGETSEKVKQMTQDFSNLASQLHETTSSMMEGAEEFLRAGNSAEDTSKLLQASTVMSKIAGQSQQESAQGLISIMNAFHMNADDMMSVVDKMVAIDNTSATSTAELNQAIQKTAASAQSAGVSFNELVSWIGTISSVSRQSASTIGAGLNSIFSRFQSIREGKNFDPEGNPLNNVEKALNRVGIAMRSDANTFRSFNDIINEVSGNWSKYNDIQKNEIATAIAGRVCA